MDITVIVALIAAVAAILAPLITTYINSKTEIKMKKIEVTYNKKLITYNEFAKNFSEMFSIVIDNKDISVNELLSSIYNVMLICNKNSFERITHFCTKLEDYFLAAAKSPNRETMYSEGYKHFRGGFFDCLEYLSRELLEFKDDNNLE